MTCATCKVNFAQRQQIADLQAKLQKQRNELARHDRRIKELEADKANLRFDLTKAKARADQLAAIARGDLS